MDNFFATLKKALYSTPGKGFFSAVMLLSSFFAVFSAAPPLVTYATQSRVKGWMVLFFGAVFTFALKAVIVLCFGNASTLMSEGISSALVYLVAVGFTCVIIGEFMRLGKGFAKTIFLSSFAIVGIYVILVVIYAAASSTGILTMISKNVLATIDIAAAAYPDGIKQALIDTGYSKQELAMFIAVRLPAAVSMLTVIFVFINVLIVARFDVKTASFLRIENLLKVKVPEYLLVPAILFGALYVYSITGYNHDKTVEMLGAFLFKSIMMIYFLHGMLLTHVILISKMGDGFLRTLLFSLIVVFAYVVVAFAGFFDTWFDFRKYLKPKEKGENL